MARSDIDTLLSLDQWASIMGFETWQFNQVGEGDGLQFARDKQCNSVWYQYSYQRQFLSRTEIGLAIAQAEAQLNKLLGYNVAPRHYPNDVIQYSSDLRLKQLDVFQPRGDWKTVNVSSGYVQSVGAKSRTLIEADVTYTESDSDGDGVNDTWTATVTSTITDTASLEVYYSDTWRNALNDTWRVRPVTITADGATITITGHLSQLVNPELQESPNPSALTVATADAFMTTIDLYQISYDSADVGTAIWDETALFTGATASVDSLIITHDKLPVLRPVIRSRVAYRNAPDRVKLNYTAGIPLDNGKVNQMVARITALLSVNYLPAQACGCARAEQILNFWSSTPTDNENGQRPMTTQEIDENPFEPTRAGLEAWRYVDLYRNSGYAAW